LLKLLQGPDLLIQPTLYGSNAEVPIGSLFECHSIGNVVTLGPYQSFHSTIGILIWVNKRLIFFVKLSSGILPNGLSDGMTTRRNIILGAGATALAGTAFYAVGRSPSYDEAEQILWNAKSPADNSELNYLVHYATLAANSHNTQPWRFGQSGNRIFIKPDLNKSTPVVDPDNHHLYASLGCACENLSLAAAAEGKSTSANFISDDEDQIEIDLAAGPASRNPLFEAILERRCTRSEYDGRPVSADDMKSLEQAVSIEGCRVLLISDKQKMVQILELIIAANTAQVEDPEFVAELKSWLRFNAASAIETGDGLYAACSGNPTLPTWLGGPIFDMLFSAKSENEKCTKQVRSSSGFAIFVSEKNDKKHWIQAGRSYQRFALQATALGMKHAFLNQPVEVSSSRPKLAQMLAIGDQRPDLVVRYGFAPPMPRSLRRPVLDVMV